MERAHSLEPSDGEASGEGTCGRASTRGGGAKRWCCPRNAPPSRCCFARGPEGGRHSAAPGFSLLGSEPSEVRLRVARGSRSSCGWAGPPTLAGVVDAAGDHAGGGGLAVLPNPPATIAPYGSSRKAACSRG